MFNKFKEKLKSLFTSRKIDEAFFEELEDTLIEGDLGARLTDEVIEALRKAAKEERAKSVEDLQRIMKDILSCYVNPFEFEPKKGELTVFLILGVNGVGKTTSIAKIAQYYKDRGYKVMLAAADTFRAAAVDQLDIHAERLGIRIVKQKTGSDPGAVVYDAITSAQSQGEEIILVDTAGRMQTNTNLMDEMKKIRRVSKPDLVVFVGDALTGNDATEQAKKFNEAIDIDGVILTKADADSKGGASLSIGYVIKKPIMFLGMGQGYDDIKEYDSEWMLNQLFSEDEE